MGPLFYILALGGGAGAAAAVRSWLHGTRPLGSKLKPTPTSFVAVVLVCQTGSTRRQRKARTPHWKSSCQGHMSVGQRGAGAFRGTFWHVRGTMTSALAIVLAEGEPATCQHETQQQQQKFGARPERPGLSPKPENEAGATLGPRAKAPLLSLGLASPMYKRTCPENRFETALHKPWRFAPFHLGIFPTPSLAR